MNENKNRRVILINGDNSKWYDQAIFIVKKNTLEKNIPVDFVAEAEKIINSYIVKTSSKVKAVATKKSQKGVDTVINILIIGTCALLVGTLFFLL